MPSLSVLVSRHSSEYIYEIESRFDQGRTFLFITVTIPLNMMEIKMCLYKFEQQESVISLPLQAKVSKMHILPVPLPYTGSISTAVRGSASNKIQPTT